jgi:hypothetical protein
MNHPHEQQTDELSTDELVALERVAQLLALLATSQNRLCRARASVLRGFSRGLSKAPEPDTLAPTIDTCGAWRP